MSESSNRNETQAPLRLRIEVRRAPGPELLDSLATLEATLGDRLIRPQPGSAPGDPPDLTLRIDGTDWTLWPDGNSTPIRVDLRPPASRRSQPLLWRACGLDQGRRRIVDATAGLGRDTALLLQGLESHLIDASSPPSLTICERDPLLRAMLFSEVLRIRTKVGLRLVDEARSILGEANREDEDQPEVVYLDPMFESHRSSALPKQDLQMLRSWCHPPSIDDTAQLVNQARRLATHRVVVKRGAKDPEVVSSPLHAVRGRSVRFDIYGPAPR